jgi:hypothetical protein
MLENAHSYKLGITFSDELHFKFILFLQSNAQSEIHQGTQFRAPFERNLLMLKLCVFVGVLTAISTMAEASALPRPVNNLVQKELKALSGASNLNRATSQKLGAQAQCADFSGQWEGVCRVNDQEHKASFTLTQKDCSSLSFDGEKIDMGHNRVEADNSALVVTNSLVTTRFSPDGKTANALATILVDSPYLPDTVSGRLGGEMRKDGESLQISGQIDLWLGLKTLAALPAECSFRKKN